MTLRRSQRTWALALLATGWFGGCRIVRGSDRHEAGPSASRSIAGPSGDPWVDGILPKVSPTEAPRAGGEVVVQTNTEPPSLNPIVDSDWWGSAISDHIYEPMVGTDPYDDPDYRFVPKLAERWEISQDRTEFTFHLRRDVKWHDGVPFTARDVIATFDKIQDPKAKTMHLKAYTQELESYRALDEFTVSFKWKRPYFLAMETPLGVGIQPAHLIEKLSGTDYNQAATNPLNRAPVGTGPFRFGEWKSNEKIVLLRHDAYRGPKAHLDRIVFRIVKDPTVALELAERGELDVVNGVPAEKWIRMQEPRLRQSFWRSKYFDANYAWIGWNLRRPLFQDARVRRALTQLVDRPGMIGGLFHGLALPTTCHFYYKSKDCDPNLAPLPYDPEAAARLLEEAGWRDTNRDGLREREGQAFRFVFMVPASSESAERMAAKMKEDFWRAGIDLRVQQVEWSAFTRRLREKNFDACTLVWGGGPRGDPTQIWATSSIPGGSNYISFSDPRVDRILRDARVLFDDAERHALYREFGRILGAEQPYTFLWVRPRLSLVGRRVHGVRESLGFWQYEDWWVDPAAS
jgi:peptide/nickel transport system substrate-binding protein